MIETDLLHLSIGDVIPEHRLKARGYSSQITLLGKQVRVAVAQPAILAAADSQVGIVAEIELYFSCLVQKRVRFRMFDHAAADATTQVRVLPGLYASFRAVTTRACAIAGLDGRPPVEGMPVSKPARFVPDWLKIDYHTGLWRAEYGFATDR